MQWQNSEARWGLIAVFLHWLVAIAAIGLFALGLYMTELRYYDSWYRTAPFIHKSLGVMLFLVVFGRLLWRLVQPKPTELPSHTAFERTAAKTAHAALYLLLFAIMFSGYLISTADGRSISVFDWFDIPALLTYGEPQAELAGTIHFYLAIGLMAIAAVHAAGALKHHFIDRDNTLKRMLGL